MEVVKAFDVSLTIEWTPVIPYQKIAKILARAMNRIIVGLPLCITFDGHTNSGRNDNFLKISTGHAASIGQVVKLFPFMPEFLKPYAVFLTILMRVLLYYILRIFGGEREKHTSIWPL